MVDEEDSDDEDGDDEAKNAWRSLLEIPARAAWRATAEGKPEILLRAQHGLVRESNRSPKQLQFTYQKVIEWHAALENRREKERRRAVNDPHGSQPLKKVPTADPIVYMPELTLANLRERLIPNFFVIRRVLQECQSLLGPKMFQPKRIIDFGIGCGSASAAALDVFDTVDWIHGVDPSRSMRDASERVLREVIEYIGSPTRVTFSGNLSSEVAGSESTTGGFDLALFAYTAMEIPQVEATLAAAAVLWEKLRPNGVFVMVEPGNPDGFNSIRAVRAMLLETCPPDSIDEGPGAYRCHIIAPCTHSQTCPMIRHKLGFVKPKKASGGHGKEAGKRDEDVHSTENHDNDDDNHNDDSDNHTSDPIIEATPLERTASHGHGAETGIFDASFCSFVHSIQGEASEKLSYLVAQKRVFNDKVELNWDHQDREQNVFRDAQLTELLGKTQKRGSSFDSSLYREVQHLAKQYLDSEEDDLGLELVRGKARTSFGRIVRAPLKKRGHIYIDYCATPGRIVRACVTKASSKAAPGIYAAARKSRWGGVWPDALGLGKEEVPDDETGLKHHEVIIANTGEKVS
jgi:ribosomal protein RSM22 (predicted rRNA methylase)